MAKTPDEIRASQPSGISSGTLTIGPRQGLYKASMHAEQQKFGSSKRDQQFRLFDQQQNIQSSEVEVTGLKLSETEDQVLSALQQLLDRTGYEGNLPGDERPRETYQGTLPRLAVSYSDFFDACGLEPGRTGHHKQEQEALEALRSLAEPKWKICYTRHKYIGEGKSRERRSDLVRWTGPILMLEQLDYYQNLDDNELERVQAGEDRPGRQRGFVFTASSLLVDQHKTFHVLKSRTLHLEIKQLHKGKRTPRALSLFVEWLLTLDKTPSKIGKDKLMEKLWLHDMYHRQRKKARVEHQLKQAIEVARKLQYLTSWQQDATGIYTFHLNPERCTRVEAKRRRALPEPD